MSGASLPMFTSLLSRACLSGSPNVVDIARARHTIAIRYVSATFRASTIHRIAYPLAITRPDTTIDHLFDSNSTLKGYR